MNNAIFWCFKQENKIELQFQTWIQNFESPFNLFQLFQWLCDEYLQKSEKIRSNQCYWAAVLKELHLYWSDVIILILKQAEPVWNFIAPQCLHNWNLRETLRPDILWVEFIVAGCLKNIYKKIPVLSILGIHVRDQGKKGLYKTDGLF